MPSEGRAFTWCRGRPTMDGKTALGASSPAKPALTSPEPLSHTSAVVSSSSHIVAERRGPAKQRDGASRPLRARHRGPGPQPRPPTGRGRPAPPRRGGAGKSREGAAGLGHALGLHQAPRKAPPVRLSGR